MQTQIQAKGFELHDAQRFVVNKGLSRISRMLINHSRDGISTNAVISCHHRATPIFTVHLHLEIDNNKLSSMATDQKFHFAFNQALGKLMSQIRKRKTNFLIKRESQKVITKTA